MMGANTIIVGVIAATGLTLLAEALDKKGEVTIKPVISGFVVGTLLLIVGLFSVSLAASFALLLLISSVFLNGSRILAAT